MELTIKSKILDREITFWKSETEQVKNFFGVECPDTTSYIFLGHDSTGAQIFHGGRFQGDAVQASNEDFEKACRRWYREFLEFYRSIEEACGDAEEYFSDKLTSK